MSFVMFGEAVGQRKDVYSVTLKVGVNLKLFSAGRGETGSAGLIFVSFSLAL